MGRIPIYGWQSYGVSRYRHFCGARIWRKGERWTARFVEGSLSFGHRTAKAAIAFIEVNDPTFWTYDELTSRGWIAGLWIETAYLDGMFGKDAFSAYFRIGDELPKYVEGVFKRYALGVVMCAKCSKYMDGFRFGSTIYFGSCYPQRKSGKGWSFVACECGHPVWFGSSLILEKRLKKRNTPGTDGSASGLLKAAISAKTLATF